MRRGVLFAVVYKVESEKVCTEVLNQKGGRGVARHSWSKRQAATSRKSDG